MFNNGVAVALLVDGKVAREYQGIVYIPFKTEYSILIKNYNNCRIAVKVEIDGENIFDNEYLSINAYSDIRLERFFKTNHKFLFIEKTQEISEHRGDFIDDGIIRVTFRKEKNITYDQPMITWGNYYVNNNPIWYSDDSNSIPKTPYEPMKIICQNSNHANIISNSENSSITITNNDNTVYVKSKAVLDSVSDIRDGITTKGKKSEQKFERVLSYPLEDEKTSITLMLKGFNKDKEVERVQYSHEKITCPICGRKNKSFHKFCFNCGTALD